MRGKKFRWVHIDVEGIVHRWGWKYRSNLLGCITLRVEPVMVVDVGAAYVSTDEGRICWGANVPYIPCSHGDQKFCSIKPSVVKQYIINKYYEKRFKDEYF